MSLGDRSRLGDRPPRHSLEAVVRLRCPGRTRVHTGFLKNLSNAGMFLRILDPEIPGTRLGFDIFFTSEDGVRSTLTGEGEVAWSRDDYEGPGLPPGMGIRFLSLGAGGAEVLHRVLENSGLGLDSEGRRPSTHDTTAPSFETTFSDAPTLILDPSSPLAVGTGFGPGAPVESGSSEDPKEYSEDFELGPNATRTSPKLRSAALWIMLLAIVAVGLFAWQRFGPSSKAISESPPIQPTNGPVSLEREETALGDAEGTDDPEGAGFPGGMVSPEVSSGLADRAQGVETPPESSESSSALSPVRHVTGVRSEVGEALTMVLLVGDGAFATDQLEHSYIGGESPRIVLRVRGVERSGDQVNETLNEGFIRAIRTGYHTGVDGKPGSLHVVLDVTSTEVKVRQVLPSGHELLIYLGPE